MIGTTGQFLFYLGAVICFVVAAFGEAGTIAGRGGRLGARRIALVPLGLALWLFPLMWNTGKAAF